MSSAPNGTSTSVVNWDGCKSFFATRRASKFCSYFLPHLKPNFHILDVGSGPGSITIDLAELVPQGHVTGLEISSETVQDSIAFASHRGVKNVQFVQGDARNLSIIFQEAKFDVVHAHMTLLHIPEPVAVIKQMRALLKPGGFIAISDQTTIVTYPLKLGLDSIHDGWRAVSAARGAHPGGGACNHTWIHEGGFPWEKIQFGVSAHEIPYENKATWVEAVKQTFPGVAQGLDELDLMGVVGMKKGDQDVLLKKWFEAWDGFERDPTARCMALDGWVIGWL